MNKMVAKETKATAHQVVIVVTASLGAICHYENEIQFHLESRPLRFYFGSYIATESQL